MEFAEQEARQWLIQLLDGQEAYRPFHQAVAGLPASYRGAQGSGAPYTIWQLVRHMQWAQHDILVYAQDSFTASPPWPSGYWPVNQVPTEAEWEEALTAIAGDQQTLKQLLEQQEASIFRPFDNGSGHTLFRQALLVAEHQAYHTGQIVLIRKEAGIWP
jgi:uncharacterized damage-inducible protein DinB